MPEVSCRTVVHVSVDEVWEFVKNMDNWAPMLTGYQRHEQRSETKSIWTVKGDVGILARTVIFEVNITEWSGPRRVAFTLTGLNEAVDGDGAFEMSTLSGSEPGVLPAPPRGLFLRFLTWFARTLFRRMHGEVERPGSPPGADLRGGAELTFTLRMNAGGPTAPLVNAMLQPALTPAAENLAAKIAAHLEKAGRKGGA